MRYYTATKGVISSPVYKYFNSIEELNAYYNINSKEEDYNHGYSFDIDGKFYLLGKDYY